MIDDANLIDPDRIAWLHDVGRPDYVAAVAVAADGTEHLVLAELDAIGDHAARYDPDCPDVRHEQLGTMPAIWRHRVALAPLRCGRPTKIGRPCRSLVTDSGHACPRHRMPAPSRDGQAGDEMSRRAGGCG
jgi:hypothetical protein